MNKLSVVVLTKNSQKFLSTCLDSVRFAQEIVVVDDNSRDKTREIAKKYTTKVYRQDLNGNFANLRNFGLSKCEFEWVLFVDSDEVVCFELAAEIVNVLESDKVGFLIRRQNWVKGKRLNFGEWGKTRLLRLAKRKAGMWKRRVHEVWYVQGKIGQLKNSLDHFGYENGSSFYEKINWYTELEATERQENGEIFRWWEMFFLPGLKFLYNYIWLQGFRDGDEGLKFAVLMSMHSLILRVKLYENQTRVN